MTEWELVQRDEQRQEKALQEASSERDRSPETRGLTSQISDSLEAIVTKAN